jgi:hypothetical protein
VDDDLTSFTLFSRHKGDSKFTGGDLNLAGFETAQGSFELALLFLSIIDLGLLAISDTRSSHGQSGGADVGNTNKARLSWIL